VHVLAARARAARADHLVRDRESAQERHRDVLVARGDHDLVAVLLELLERMPEEMHVGGMADIDQDAHASG